MRRLNLKLTFAFGTCETLNYSFEDKKKNQNIFRHISRVIIPQKTYSKESSKKIKSRKVSTTGFLHLPNNYLIIFRLIFYTHFFIKTKQLMFYSVVMADIGALAEF